MKNLIKKALRPIVEELVEEKMKTVSTLGLKDLDRLYLDIVRRCNLEDALPHLQESEKAPLSQVEQKRASAQA